MYILKESFRVTAYSQFGKAVAKLDLPSFPDDHVIINLILDSYAEHAEVKKIYTVQ